MINEEKRYEIPEGGEFSLYCEITKDFNFESIKDILKIYNIDFQYIIDEHAAEWEDDIWMGLFDSSNEQICATTDKYSLDKEDKEEMVSDYIEAYGKNSDIVNTLVNIFKNSDSYYHFDTQDCKSAAFVYLFAYVLSEVKDVFLVDHYNGYDMVGNDLKIAFDSAKSYINSNDNDNNEMNFDETIDVSNSLDIVEKNLKEINKKIEKAIGYISSQDFDKAKKLLNSCTSLKYVYPKSDLESPFYTFNDLLEYYCSKNVLKSDIEHKWFRTR